MATSALGRPAPAPDPAIAPEAAAIRTDRLTKRYGNRAAVDDLSITVPAGTVTGFIGPNGAGKSTTIRMLLGLIAPSDGDATVLGQPIGRPSAYLGRVGALVEAPSSYPGLTARANLEILAALGGHDLARVGPILAQVGLAGRAGDRVKSFSLGMRQRLGIAAALLPAPELLVLDEPVNGLDPAGIQEVRELLRGLSREGMTVFVSSHLLAELEQVADWIVVVRGGRLVFQGPTAELLARRVGGLVVRVEDPAGYPILERVCAAAGHATHRDGDRLLVQSPAEWASTLNRRAIEAGLVLSELTPARGSLEDAFLDIVDDGLTGDGGEREGGRS